MGFVIEFLVTHVFSYRSSHAGERRAKRVKGVKNDFLKKYLQTRKGLQKLDTKHDPKEDFQNFEFFQIS